MSKHTIVVQTIKKLKLNEQDILNHNQKKGIYLGMIGDVPQDFLISKNHNYNSPLKTVEHIFENYKKVYGLKRHAHLLKTNRFKE